MLHQYNVKFWNPRQKCQEAPWLVESLESCTYVYLRERWKHSFTFSQVAQPDAGFSSENVKEGTSHHLSGMT